MVTRFFSKRIFNKAFYFHCISNSAFDFYAVLLAIPGGQEWNCFKRLVIGKASLREFFQLYFWAFISCNNHRLSLFIYPAFYFIKSIANCGYCIFNQDYYIVFNWIRSPGRAYPSGWSCRKCSWLRWYTGYKRFVFLRPHCKPFDIIAGSKKPLVKNIFSTRAGCYDNDVALAACALYGGHIGCFCCCGTGMANYQVAGIGAEGITISYKSISVRKLLDSIRWIDISFFYLPSSLFSHPIFIGPALVLAKIIKCQQIGKFNVSGQVK